MDWIDPDARAVRGTRLCGCCRPRCTQLVCRRQPSRGGNRHSPSSLCWLWRARWSGSSRGSDTERAIHSTEGRRTRSRHLCVRSPRFRSRSGLSFCEPDARTARVHLAAFAWCAMGRRRDRAINGERWPRLDAVVSDLASGRGSAPVDELTDRAVQYILGRASGRRRPGGGARLGARPAPDRQPR